MILKNFDELIGRVKLLPKKKVVVLAAADNRIIQLVKALDSSGIADYLLVGDKAEIQLLAKSSGADINPEHIVDAKGEMQMAEKAMSLVRENKADLIMKGHLPTSTFLKLILDREKKLRGNGQLSQVSIFEKISGDGLQLMSDCAINICPGLEQKQKIIMNSLRLARSIGYLKPRVAMLAAVETVNPNMPETIDAAVLSKMAERGQMGDCLIDGPLALDNALSLESARHKGIENNVAGRADILIVPDVRMGNGLHKSLVYFAKKRVAGLVMGAGMPIIMSSRSDSTESKLLSIALAVYLLKEEN